jgi:hypothetical protein
MNFRIWCESFYGNTVDATLADDEFIHFTTASRAKQILQNGKLLMEPPYKKFGTDTVDAISLRHGMFNPGVQFTHIKITPDDPLVAILFKTNLKPYAAYPEEVKWNVDVPLINAKIISKNQAQSLLKPAIEQDYEIRYK